MTDTERLKRQETLEVFTNQDVAVVGCGGVGSWVALNLGLAGVAGLHVFDGDTVEVHNLNRLPLPRSSVGMSKSEAVCQMICDCRGDLAIYPHGNFDPAMPGHQEALAGCRTVIVSTDSYRSRRMVYEACKKAGVERYIEAGADGECGTVFFTPAEFESPLEEDPGYASVPVFVGPCVMAAAVATYYALKNINLPAEKVLSFGWKKNRFFFKESR